MFGTSGAQADFVVDANYTLPERTADGEYDHIFAHVYLAKEGHHPDPLKSPYNPTSIVYRRISLLGKMPKPAAKVHLLQKPSAAASAAESNEVSSPTTLVQYWYPEVKISLVQDQNPLDWSKIPPGMRKHYLLTMDYRYYLPTVYLNEFWRLRYKRVLLDDAVTSMVPLRISFSSIGLLKFQILTTFDQSLQMNESLFGGDEETEKLKQMFVETNPYLLLVTLLVSILHSIFDILAFKNDIQFWRKKDNLQGLSARSVILNAFSQTVILLYLLDQETSWLIIVSSSLGTLIELWKITRVLNIHVKWTGRLLPSVNLSFKSTYATSETQEHDRTAMRFLYKCLAVLLCGYAVYSLFAEKHKGWYSWILGTLVGFVYSFGFVMMMPQLFINYKLKSVAHMPWRVFIYKALNTFIDDLFAFVIKMPTLHRLACFRDDVIFVIYLVQRWMYRVDKSRANEYGQVFEGEEEEKEGQRHGSDKAPGAPHKALQEDGASARKRTVKSVD